MKNPKISVLTPIYNTNPEHLRECVESILAQTFRDFEFLILNDSPTNKALGKIVKSYKDPRIKYVENAQNLGISASRNKLIEMARGEYLAVFDHDDISMPTRLEKQAAFLDANPDVGVVSSNWRGFSRWEWRRNPEKNLDIKFSLTRECRVSHTAAMIRRSALGDVRYEAEFSPAEDHMLFIRLLPRTMFYNIQEFLVRYRSGGTSRIKRQKMLDSAAMVKNIARLLYPHFIRPEKYWIKLFGLVPIVRIRHRRALLFGLLPLWSTK